MSDLDADLYGNIYGNDEVDLEPTHNDTEAFQSTEHHVDESPAPKAPTPEETNKHMPIPTTMTSNTSSSMTEKPYSNGNSVSTPATANGTANQSTFNAAVLQNIPTYEQPQPSEYYHDMPSRSNGAYQNISVTEHSICLSLMKDEGYGF